MSDCRCTEVRQFAHAYMDGEFDEREAALFEERLSNCPECRAYFDEQTWLMGAVKPILQRPTRMPAQFKRRLESELRRVQRPEKFKRALRYFTHPIPVAVMATGLLFLVRPGFSPTDTEVEPQTQVQQRAEVPVKVDAQVTRVSSPVGGVSEAVDQHLQTLPIERPTPEHSDVENWFVGKVPFNVNALRFQDHRVNLLGGRISRFRPPGVNASQPAARLFYQVGGHKMSVLVLNDSEASLRGVRAPSSSEGVQIHDAGRHRVATFRQNGLTYILTSELSPNEMRAVIESAR